MTDFTYCDCCGKPLAPFHDKIIKRSGLTWCVECHETQHSNEH